MDYVDLMLIHRPPPTSAGEKLWEQLIKARQECPTLDIGVSNYSSSLLEKLIEATSEVPTLNQIEWSLLGHSKKMLKYCQDKDISIQDYSQLTRTKRLEDKTLAQIVAK